jgi:hypothetical protein
MLCRRKGDIQFSGMENARPFFKTKEEQDAFYQRLQEAVRPELEKQREARAHSEQDAMNHWVD